MPPSGDVGVEQNYAATVRNGGPNASTGSPVTFQLHPSIQYRGSPSGHACSYDGATARVTCPVGMLLVNRADTVRIVVLPMAAGTFAATASVIGAQNDPDGSNNAATKSAQYAVRADVALSGGVIQTPAAMGVGGETTFTVTVVNDGPSPSSGSRVRFNLPEGILYLRPATAHACTPDATRSVVDCTVGALPGGGVDVGIVALVNVVGTFQTIASLVGNDLDPIPSNNSAATFANYPGPACPARGAVPVAVRAYHHAYSWIRVTVDASQVVPTNKIQRIRFLISDSALVSIGGLPQRAAPFTHEHGDRPVQSEFYVARTVPGSIMTVRMLVIDDCGEWPTFVGAGENAF